MKIYTKRGDGGETSLAGGQRIAKEDIRVEAYGTLDELVCWMGLLHDHLAADPTREFLGKLQGRVFQAGGVIAAPGLPAAAAWPAGCLRQIEDEIDRLNQPLPTLRTFILPGGHPAVSTAHLARAVCRRAERRVLHLHRREPLPLEILAFLNRLSDYFFVLARHLSQAEDTPETPYQPDHAS